MNYCVLLCDGLTKNKAELSRKGRSRNWQLQADHNQIREITTLIYQSEESRWLWFAKKINDGKPPLSQDELRTIAKQNPMMSVNQIVSLTDCSISDARKVLDEIENTPQRLTKYRK